MSVELNRARGFADAGKYNKALAWLWAVEPQARTSLDEAQGLVKMATSIREHVTGRGLTQCDELLAIGHAAVTRLASDPRTGVLVREALAVVSRCDVIGGAGLPPRVGETWDAVFTRDALRLVDLEQREATVPYDELTAIEIGGPGATRGGGGFFGGGFGLEGAAEGMLIASALSLLTTRTSIDTILCLQTKSAELFLLNHKMTPDTLRIRLSPVFTILRQRSSTPSEPPPQTEGNVVDQLAKLSELLDRGLIDEDEFRKLKGEILG